MKDTAVDKSFFKGTDLSAVSKLEETLAVERRDAWLIGKAARGNRHYEDIRLLMTSMNPASGNLSEDYARLKEAFSEQFIVRDDEEGLQLKNAMTRMKVVLARRYFS